MCKEDEVLSPYELHMKEQEDLIRGRPTRNVRRRVENPPAISEADEAISAILGQSDMYSKV